MYSIFLNNRRALFSTAIIFFGLHIFFMVVTEPGKNIAQDSRDFLRTAQALLHHGAFVNLENPDISQSFRQPGYGIFLFLAMIVTDSWIWLIVAIQTALLFLTGLFAYRMTEDWLPGYGVAALCLVIFNPSACGNAHFILSDTLFTFIFMMAVWSLFCFFKNAQFSK